MSIFIEARKSFEQALPLYKKVGAILGEANCIQSLGDIHFMESRNDEARKSFEQALPLYKKVGAILGEANCIKSLGDILLKEGKTINGKKNFEEAIKLYKKINNKYSIAVAFYELGIALKDKSEYCKETKELFIKASEIFESINLPNYANMCKKLANS